MVLRALRFIGGGGGAGFFDRGGGGGGGAFLPVAILSRVEQLGCREMLLPYEVAGEADRCRKDRSGLLYKAESSDGSLDRSL